MIKANELRRNNILNVDGNYWKVDAILEDELYFEENPEYNHLLNAKPIPLTEELLLKCGFINEFEDEEDNSYFTLKNIEIQKILFKEEFFLDNVNNISVSIKYLHQLQNLYFVLTGTELEIKL